MPTFIAKVLRLGKKNVSKGLRYFSLASQSRKNQHAWKATEKLG